MARKTPEIKKDGLTYKFMVNAAQSEVREENGEVMQTLRGMVFKYTQAVLGPPTAFINTNGKPPLVGIYAGPTTEIKTLSPA